MTRWCAFKREPRNCLLQLGNGHTTVNQGWRWWQTEKVYLVPAPTRRARQRTPHVALRRTPFWRVESRQCKLGKHRVSSRRKRLEALDKEGIRTGCDARATFADWSDFIVDDKMTISAAILPTIIVRCTAVVVVVSRARWNKRGLHPCRLSD